MRARSVTLLLSAGLAAFSAGCGVLWKPDLSRTTPIASLRKPPRPLIFIHGFLGSKLRNPETRSIAWGRMTNVLFGGDNDSLKLALDGEWSAGEDLEAYQIYDELWGVDYYREILRSLRTAGGYRIGDIDDPKPGDNAFVFVYDWRRDNVESARLLAEAIDRLEAALGDPDLRFDLLTHSQGGLIARYYVKYGGVDVLDRETPAIPTMAGAEHVNKVIMLGTPNRGCLQALKILHVGVKKVFRPMRPEVVFTMPSIYQMLPHRGQAVFVDEAGNSLDLDIYDAETWARQGWSAFSKEAQKRARRRMDLSAHGLAEHDRRLSSFLDRSLRRADAFHRALDAPAAGEGRIAYHAFGGDCKSTPKTAIVTRRRGEPVILFEEDRGRDEMAPDHLAEVLYGPGDGTVLMQSLLDIGEGEPGTDDPVVDFDSVFFVCENHGVLANNPIFQNNLLYLLLREEN